jgi:hypothetical protein
MDIPTMLDGRTLLAWQALKIRLDALVKHYNNPRLEQEFGPPIEQVLALVNTASTLCDVQADFVFRQIVNKVRNSSQKQLSDDDIRNIVVFIDTRKN